MYIFHLLLSYCGEYSPYSPHRQDNHRILCVDYNNICRKNYKIRPHNLKATGSNPVPAATYQGLSQVLLELMVVEVMRFEAIGKIKI